MISTYVIIVIDYNKPYLIQTKYFGFNSCLGTLYTSIIY